MDRSNFHMNIKLLNYFISVELAMIQEFLLIEVSVWLEVQQTLPTDITLQDQVIVRDKQMIKDQLRDWGTIPEDAVTFFIGCI